MQVKSKRLFVSFCLALVMAVSFVLGACLAWLPRAVRAEGERYKLDFSAEDFSAWKIDGISYDVSFDFSTAGKTNGWFANSVPTLEDITMSWTGVEESVTARDIGEIYGIARSVTGENADFLFYAGESDAMGFVYNGGADTFTKQGTATTVEYTKALAAENKITVTGSEMTFNAYVGTYAAADAAGAQYLGVQWTGTEKPYSASLADVKIYNAGGLDLGVQISANATSSSVQRYGDAGEEITVYPVQKTGQEFVGLTATPADGEAYALDVTDNYDGSYSFVMPQEDVAVSAVYTNRYALTLGDGVQTTSIDGISYDVDFAFNDGGGWFANDLPSSEDITMRWLGVSQERTGSANPGEVYGVVRSVNDDNPHMIQMAPSSGFRFTFNASTNTYTNPGESTILSYSKALVAGGTESVYYNGSPNRYTFHQMDGYKTFAEADAAGAQYLAVQWLAGTYSASLTNVKINDASGNDLGIQLGEYTLDSQKVQRYGAAGQTITIRLADPQAGYIFDGWQVTGEGGSTVNVPITDNGDGTYSFVMPEQAITVTPQYVEYNAVMHTLDIVGGTTTKIEGVAYNVSFESEISGWFANSVPTLENITMSWESTAESVESRGGASSGEVYGIARSSAATDKNYIYNSAANGAMGFGGAYNGGSETFTKQGTATVIEYSRQLNADRAAQQLTTGAVYLNGQILEMHYLQGSYKAADDAGAQYLAVQWNNSETPGVTRPYSATLQNVKITNESGDDLGIQFSSNLKKAEVQRMGQQGKTITIRAEAASAGYNFIGWKVTDANNEAFTLAVTDNKDGTYSFVMPEEAVTIEAQYESLFEDFYALDIEGGTTTKIEGVGYDVSFAYESSGWFANSVPTTEDITMSWTSTAENVAARDIGEIYGLARTAYAVNQSFIFYSGANDIMGYNGSYNGGSETFTKQGTATTIEYTKALAAENKVTVNGSAMPFISYPDNSLSYKRADDAGAQYLAVQWINGEGAGKAYSATLRNVKIYTPEGEDLGIQFSSTATSATVQRVGEAGKTVTVRPEERTGFAFTGWKVTSGGEDYTLNITDNKDGTYSFTMPSAAVKLEAQYEDLKYALDIEGGYTTKIDGISYDVQFDFSGDGWFGNNLPSSEDITMTWTTVSQERTGDFAPFDGHVYGFVRSVTDADRQLLFNAESAADLGFTINGTTQTYTNPGETTVVRYSKELVAGGTNSLYLNDAQSTYSKYKKPTGGGWKGADDAGAQYLAVQWIGGTYKASLTGVKIYDASGNDLGIQFGEATLESSSVQRYGEAGKTVTIAPEVPENYQMDYWTVTDAAGNPYELNMTDNGDGTYSFVMPEQALKIKANLKYEVVETEYYGWYYNIQTGSMIQLKEGGVAEITENGQTRTASYEIPYVTELKITEGETTQSYALTVGKFQQGESVWYKMQTFYVTFETQTDTAIETQVLKDGNYKAAKPADPAREGYTFGGWYTSDGEEFDFNSIVYESVTLHAKWIPVDAGAGAGGCSGSLGGTAVMVSAAALFAAAAWMIRRRKDTND